MHDKIDIVEQDPLRLFVAFGVSDAEAQGFEAFVNGVGDGLDLAGIGSAAHDEIVGESTRIFFQLEDGEVVGLFVLAGQDGFVYLVLEVVLFLHSEMINCNAARDADGARVAPNKIGRDLLGGQVAHLPLRELCQSLCSGVAVEVLFFYVVGNFGVEPSSQRFALSGGGADGGGGDALVDSFEQVKGEAGENQISGGGLLVEWTRN